MRNNFNLHKLNVCHIPLVIAGIVHMNSSLLYDSVTGEAMVIDPGGEADKICGYIGKKKLKLKYIVVTHGHFDHIMAVSELAAKTGAQVCMNRKEEFFIYDSQWNAVYVRNLPPVTPFRVDLYLKDGDRLMLGSQTIKVLEIPGHTPGHLAYYIDGHLFSGDTILKGTTGRMDLQGADIQMISRSIREKLFLFPDDTIVHCGHGEETTIGYERMNNDILHDSLEEN